MFFNFGKYSVDFDTEKLSFKVMSDLPGVGCFVSDAQLTFQNMSHEPLAVEEFASYHDSEVLGLEDFCWCRTYTGGPYYTPELWIGIRIGLNGVRFFCNGRAFVRVQGRFNWGADPANATFSIRKDSEDSVFGTASGPVTAAGDDALFDRLTDRLLVYSTAGDINTHYCWEENCYRFDFVNGLDYGRELDFRIVENFCADKFHVPYAPISYKHGFDTPPVGWMTWYAIQFKACEKLVLENGKRFMERFGDYTDKCVMWVDWEWCHSCWDGRGEGCDIFNPRKEPYPRGLKALSDDLRQMGMIPALWSGATNDGQKNALMQEHPEWVLAQMPMWCGQWWVDPSHPGVVEEYIPAIFRKIQEWGFEMIKWDCLPGSLEVYSKFHHRFHDPSISPNTALRQLVAAARKVVGDKVYMLSCAGDSLRDICNSMDIFDAARIGGDIFSWDSFVDQGLDRIFHTYPWHNTAFYVDADNLVLRTEFNNLQQARTRVSIYGLAGLPVNVGDSMDDLDEERIFMLQRLMPVLSIHPGGLDSRRHGREIQLTNLAIARPYGKWNVVGVTNLTNEKRSYSLDFVGQFRLPKGRYGVYDFWNGEFLGVFSGKVELELAAFDTRVLRITPVNDEMPTVVSTSRHITQGGYELLALKKDGKSLKGTIRCNRKEPCRITLLLPEEMGEVTANLPLERDGRIAVVTVPAQEAATTQFQVQW